MECYAADNGNAYLTTSIANGSNVKVVPEWCSAFLVVQHTHLHIIPISLTDAQQSPIDVTAQNFKLGQGAVACSQNHSSIRPLHIMHQSSTVKWTMLSRICKCCDLIAGVFSVTLWPADFECHRMSAGTSIML